MESMENTFKMRKETKNNTVLCKAKRAQKEKAHYQAKSGPSHVEKESPNPNQMISNWRKTSCAWLIVPHRPTTRRWWREGLVRGRPNGGHMAHLPGASLPLLRMAVTWRHVEAVETRLHAKYRCTHHLTPPIKGGLPLLISPPQGKELLHF